MNKSILTSLALLFSISILAQTAPNKYWVQFTDKDNTPHTITSPETFLSQESIDRKEARNIPIDARDLPVDPVYVQSVLDLGDISVINYSKWFNAISIYMEDSTLVEDIEGLVSVNQVKSVQAIHTNPVELKDDYRAKNALIDEEEYGPSYTQISMLNGQFLHDLGYFGEGINIAVLDAGFRHTDILPIFSMLRDDGRIIDTHDFVDGDDYVYEASNHGMQVLSTMAGYMTDSLIGTGFKANYHLFRTEESGAENVVEEDNWVAAAEYADSLGIDLFNTSLGYSLFDDPSMDHSYEEMDGNTTRITIATDIAAEKGMLLVNSAGNSGSSSWHYITAPSDADSCLTVGAVNAAETHVSFSSFGPTFDGRVKPDVMAMGGGSVVADTDSTIRTSSGTSFSSPIMAGMAACLWEACPERSNMEIIDAIRQSAHLYSTPNDSMGYGIPDFEVAYNLLHDPKNIDEIELQLAIYPTLFHESFSVELKVENSGSLSIQLFDLRGRELFNFNRNLVSSHLFTHRFTKEAQDLPNGLYLLKAQFDGKRIVRKVEKY